MCGGLPAQQLMVQVCSAEEERTPEGTTPESSASQSRPASTIRVTAAQLSFRGRRRESKLSYLLRDSARGLYSDRTRILSQEPF